MRHINQISKGSQHPATAVNILALGQLASAFATILNALGAIASVGFGGLVPVIVFAQESKDLLTKTDTFNNN
jgi:hypothetical protein